MVSVSIHVRQNCARHSSRRRGSNTLTYSSTDPNCLETCCRDVMQYFGTATVKFRLTGWLLWSVLRYSAEYEHLQAGEKKSIYIGHGSERS
ncbi:hypothetical protein ACHQM5_000901 [Ranunculus cassubicifolius]